MKRKTYSSHEKLQIYKAYQGCQNKSAVARQFGIDRSYLIQIIAECDDVLLSHFDHKKAGRKKAGQVQDVNQAVEQIESLKAKNLELATSNEELYVSHEFMKLQLSWAERDGYTVKNRHIKKKKSKR